MLDVGTCWHMGQSYLLLVVVSVATPSLSAAVALSAAAATSPSVSASAAFMLSTAGPLSVSTLAALPLMAVLLPVEHTSQSEDSTTDRRAANKQC